MPRSIADTEAAMTAAIGEIIAIERARQAKALAERDARIDELERELAQLKRALVNLDYGAEHQRAISRLEGKMTQLIAEVRQIVTEHASVH